jgi:hypothetical protein
MATANALFEHVLGAGDPSQQLLDHGRLPDGWVEQYRQLLATAEAEWVDETMWPRPMVVALYYALTHLDVRYAAWRAFQGGRRDEATERELASVTGPTRLFFARAFPKDSGR